MLVPFSDVSSPRSGRVSARRLVDGLSRYGLGRGSRNLVSEYPVPQVTGRSDASRAPAVELVALRVDDRGSPTEAAIAKEAYIYGFPMVDSYRIEYAYFVDRQDPEYKGPWNQIRNIPRVLHAGGHGDPNAQLRHAVFVARLDLRAEPLVLTVPKIEKERYFSVQFIDLYTFNFAYLGSRATGNDGGSFLVAGPGWKGATPKGIKKVIRSETDLALAVYRTQLFNPSDLDNVKKVQAGYKVQTLSAFLGTAAPRPRRPLTSSSRFRPSKRRPRSQFFNILNFILQFCPTDPSEKALMARFAKIGIGAGKTFDASKLSPEMKTAIEQGMADAWATSTVC